MQQVLEVIYHDGILTPILPLDLPDNQRLKITLDVPASARTPVNGQTLASELLRIGRECASLPILDDRPSETILGYDDRGALQT